MANKLKWANIPLFALPLSLDECHYGGEMVRIHTHAARINLCFAPANAINIVRNESDLMVLK